MKKIYSLIVSSLLTLSTFGQSQSSVRININKDLKFKYEALIIPGVLIGYGVIGLESHTLKDIIQILKMK
jgi:hypothetical protein